MLLLSNWYINLFKNLTFLRIYGYKLKHIHIFLKYNNKYVNYIVKIKQCNVNIELRWNTWLKRVANEGIQLYENI